MKTKLIICLLAAIGLHAGLMFVGTGSGPELPVNAMIEVGLESGEENATAETPPSDASPVTEPVPVQQVPSPPLENKVEPEPQEVVEKPVMPEKQDAPSAEAPPQPAPASPVVSAPVTPVTARLAARPAPARSGGGGSAENVSSVRYRDRASLSYPVSALRQKIGGTVVLLVEIDTTGHATSVTVRQSSGQPDLDAAAIRCARQSTYEPYRVNGIARTCRVEAPFEFKAPRQ